MQTPNTPELTTADVSISDLEAMTSGTGSITAPTPVVTAPVVPEPVVPAPVVPAVAAPEAPEAIADQTPAVEPVETIETEEDPVETPLEPKEEKEEKKPKKASWEDKRLSKLSQQRREAVALAETEKRRSEGLQRELDALRTAQPGPAATPAAATPVSAKPVLATFVAALKDGEAYEVAVERYTDAKIADAQTARDAKRTADTAADFAKAQQAEFAKDRNAAREINPDFDDIVDRVVSQTSPGLQQVITQIQDSDGKAAWPALTMFLDEHPAELTALSAQFQANPYGAAARLGRIAATLSPKTEIRTPTPAVVRVPKVAAKPPSAVNGTAVPGVIDLQKITDMDQFVLEAAKYL